MDYLSYMTSILSIAKRGIDLCFIIFNWFTRVPHEQRAELLRQFLILYAYGYTTSEKTSDCKPPQEDIDYYKKDLRDKYIDTIEEMVNKNLSEDVFYRQLCDFVFIDEGNEISAEMFWRFYACVQYSGLPYCRVEVEITSLPSGEEYAECKEKIQDVLREIDEIVLSPEYEHAMDRAKAILECVEKGESRLEKTILLEEALFLFHYTSCHWDAYQKYVNDDKDFEIVIDGKKICTFSRDVLDCEHNDVICETHISEKELFKAYIQVDKEKLAKTFCIMRFIETNKLGTYFEQAQLLLSHIGAEPDFIQKVVLLKAGFRYFDELRDTLKNRINIGKVTMNWYLWTFA